MIMYVCMYVYIYIYIYYIYTYQIYSYLHRRSYRNGCEMAVFLITLKNVTHYYYNDFEENIYIYILYI